MAGKEDAPASWGHYRASSNTTPKKYWRSASWTSSESLATENEEKDGIGMSGNSGNNGDGQRQKFPVPLIPRAQQNRKARPFLPPLQPLAIARRSLDKWPTAGSDDTGEWPETPTLGVNKSGEKLKLDFPSIQRNSNKGGGLLKEDKIAFFYKQCSKVAEHIYLGGDIVARDKEILKQNGITHILNCVGFVCSEYFKSDFVYMTLWLQDNPSEDITSILYDVFDYFEDVRELKGRVFVHCCQGVSRSTSLVIAYLMWREGKSFDDAFQYVKEARCIADPNMGFTCQLLQCQKRVHAFPLSPSSLLRMYRMAPHSRYDPLHLVPKLLNEPSAKALDSRGAFIVQVPCAIFVWIGKTCEAIMERDTRDVVSQIVRYEKAEVPVHVFKEGEEPSFFWETFSEFIMNKSANEEEAGKPLPRERKVDLFDVDFEIFQKAIMGGFIPPFASSDVEHEIHLPARENNWSILRRKFASGNMKDFVLTPKFVSNRHHSDPKLNHSHDNFVQKPPESSDSISSSSPTSAFSFSSTSSLSSSSPYLFPYSISSNSSKTSSSKYYAETTLLESSLTSPSSSHSNFSKLSLSSKFCGNNSNHPQYTEVNLDCQPALPVSKSSRRSYPSIAGRRGYSSDCMNLPVGDDDSQKDYLKNSIDAEDAVKVNTSSSILLSSKNRENATEFKHSSIHGNEDSQELAKNVLSCDFYQHDSPLCAISDKPRGKYSLDKNSEAKVLLARDFVAVPENRDMNHPLVYQFPSLEKVYGFGVCVLDAKSAFVIAAPRTCSSPLTEDRNLYLWMGKSFRFDKSQDLANNMIHAGDVDMADMDQLGREILPRLGFLDSDIKIVKEGEEPAEFLAMLSTMQHVQQEIEK